MSKEKYYLRVLNFEYGLAMFTEGQSIAGLRDSIYRPLQMEPVSLSEDTFLPIIVPNFGTFASAQDQNLAPIGIDQTSSYSAQARPYRLKQESAQSRLSFAQSRSVLPTTALVLIALITPYVSQIQIQKELLNEGRFHSIINRDCQFLSHPLPSKSGSVDQ
jgi:hypothetical protein